MLKRASLEELYIPRPDDRVEIIGTKTMGVVISVDGLEAELLVGKMKVRVAYNKLRDRGGTSKGPRPEVRAKRKRSGYRAKA